MENPRPEKVAVVDEVRAKFEAADAAVLTEYRGLNVSATAELRRALRAAGGEVKIYKNTRSTISSPGRPPSPSSRVTRSTWPRRFETSPRPTRP